MSLYNGLLLYDVAETPINNWTEYLGTRGMWQEWHYKDTSVVIRLLPDDDAEEWEDAWFFNVEDDDTGNIHPVTAGTFAHCKAEAVKYMQSHQGWIPNQPL